MTKTNVAASMEMTGMMAETNVGASNVAALTETTATAETNVAAPEDCQTKTSYFPWTIYSAACFVAVVEEASACSA